MITKSAFPALGAPMSPAWAHESPVPRNWHCQNLSKAATSPSPRLSSGGCEVTPPVMSRAAFCQGLVFVVVVVSFDNHGPPIVMLYYHRVVTVTVPFVDLAVLSRCGNADTAVSEPCSKTPGICR